ncbi:MAG: class I SAM-dependent methyltransferase [Gemmatimonadota bacterium]|nr:MAG: class I SAM-dependent methyltransferase [Gemmatimonadota bacterium]
MFSASADFYDLFYAAKDYEKEAATVAALIRARHPDAARLLDVACGSGEHGRYFAIEHGFQVEGVDIEPRFVELARAKNPAGVYHCGDMVDFQLERTYDAVVCLFSSIGYVRELHKLHRAVAAMADHLAERGILVVEPWFEPGTMEHGFVTCATVDAPGAKVCRMTHTALEGRLSRLRFEYLIGTREGLRREVEIHELGLFSREEMEAAFQTAGLVVDYDPEGLIGRGLYIAWRA